MKYEDYMSIISVSKNLLKVGFVRVNVAEVGVHVLGKL